MLSLGRYITIVKYDNVNMQPLMMVFNDWGYIRVSIYLFAFVLIYNARYNLLLYIYITLMSFIDQ